MAEDNYSDISSVESVDGLVVLQTNPFYPNVDAKYTEDGAIEGYDITFNQGYIFNRVSESQVSDIDGKCKISEMDKTHSLLATDSKKYYVKVVVNASDFLIDTATFTGFDAGSSPPVTNFPEILFADETEATSYTAYYPVLEFQKGAIKRYTQRNNIFLSDRQFKQLGSEGENVAQVLVKEGKELESNPVRVRAVKGEGDIEVTQAGD